MSNIRRWLILLCFSAFFTVAAALPLPNVVTESPIEGITEHRLDNGLRIVLAPDDKAPVIALNLVYLTGARADRDGEGGTAHLLEHLLFKGTTKLPDGRLVSEMTQRGIRFNATTSHDRTLYQAVLAPDAAQLDWLLAMEADRMVNTQFNQADLDKEIPVVLREMEIRQSNPMTALGHELIAVEDPYGYGRHPLGTRGEVKKLTIKGVRSFYQTYYRPDNAVLILSGKFDPAKTLASVQQHFGPIAAIAPTAATLSKSSPASITSRKVSIKRGETSMMMLAYPIPAAANPLAAEFGVLTDVLVGNPHGRLYQALVTKGKATAVAANPQALHDMGMFFFSAVLDANQPAADAQKIMSSIIEHMDQHPITTQELQRAQKTFSNIRAQVLADSVTLGNVLAENAAAGDWRLFFKHSDRVSRLSIADVQQAAAVYLKDATRISGELMADTSPQNAGNGTAPAPAPKSEAAAGLNDKPANASPLPIVKDAEIDKLEAGIQRFTLTNGLQVALLPKPSSGNRVQGRLNLRFGDEKSLFGKRQIADLTASMLTYGTRTSSQQQLADRLNSLGARIAVTPDDDHVSVRFETSRASLTAVLELIAEVLREPVFPEAELDRMRRMLETDLIRQRSVPEMLANEELTRRSSPYPQGDMRRPPGSDEEMAALAQVKRADLQRFHAGFYGADHGELAMVGDFDAAQVRQSVGRLLGDWKSQASYSRPPRPFRAPTPGTFTVPAPGKSYGQYLALLRFPLRDDAKEAAALMLVNHIFGGKPLGSRLTERLRNREGLSYVAGTKVSFSSFEDNGSLTIAAPYPPEQREQIKSAVHDELTRLVKGGITAGELQQAKEALLQQSRQSRSNDGQLLALLPLQLRTGRSMHYLALFDAAIAAATVDEVNAAIRQYIDPAKLVEVLADANVAQQQAQQ